MGVHLHAKCHVSSVILTSFRQGGGGGEGNFTLSTSKPAPKKPTQIRVKASRETKTF